MKRLATVAICVCCSGLVSSLQAADAVRPARERFAAADAAEVPDFQRHVLPLMGRLGCNGRACHGSFQGQGGFRLSLFGYDFDMDHDALLAKDEGRVDTEVPELSLILRKPTLGAPHKGGKVLEEDTWAYHLLYRWLEEGAKPAAGAAEFDRLEITPSEIRFEHDGQQVPLKVIAHWSDGSTEDVTCLTRFRTNDEGIAEVDINGVVTSKGKGDTDIVAFYDNGIAPVPVIRAVSDKVGPNYPDVPTPTRVDELIVEKLRKLGVVPSEVCSDEEFLRRASLDVTGTLPTPDEARAFRADNAPDKRSRKIDELLERPTYAAWWTNKFCDFLGNTRVNFNNNSGADIMARNWYRWMYQRVADNVPYDELIAGIVLGVSREPGQSYEDFIKQESAYFRTDDPADFAKRATMPYFWARRNLRQAEEKALGFSYAFLGVRLECAQCHKHPFDQWTQDDFKQFQAFFEQVRYGNSPEYTRMLQDVREEKGFNEKKGNINIQRELTNLAAKGEVVPWQELLVRQATASRRPDRDRKGQAERGRRVPARALGGEEVDLAAYKDAREPIMEWLRSPENPYFARAFVNRVWANYFGVGIINPPDDMNLANPPSNVALLDHLADGFIAHKFDMKWLHREVLNSAAYQRSWQPNATNRLDERNFSHALVRRLPAEIVMDAVTQATAGSAELATATSEVENRAFGPVAGTGSGRRGTDYAGRVFGRATRDTNCDCSRSDEPNLLQAIYLENDPELLAQLDRKGGWISEVTSRLRAGSSEGREGIEDRIEAMEAKLKALREKGKDEEAIEALEERLAKLRRQAEVKPSTLDEKQIEALAEEAFLRVLSRRPSASELASTLGYFREAADAAAGLRGTLWALLNTKEFITNH